MASEELEQTILDGVYSVLANTHTSTIAKVVAINETTIDVQPVISRVVEDVSYTMPVFPKVIPFFLGGGSSHDTFPISVGDYCLLIIAERCLDRWYDGQDNLPPAEQRMHDYSDAIALVGLHPKSSALTIPSKVKRVGDADIEGDQDIVGDIDLTGDYTQIGNMEVTGNITVTGNIICTGILTVQSMVIGGPGGTPVTEQYFNEHKHAVGTYKDAEGRALNGQSGNPV